VAVYRPWLRIYILHNSTFLFTDFHGRYIGVGVAYRGMIADAARRVARTVVDGEVTSDEL